MTNEQYTRAVQISRRIKELKDIQKELGVYDKCMLQYVYKSCDGSINIEPKYLMDYISELLEKHDKMIRTEIEEEIQKLKNEIETL